MHNHGPQGINGENAKAKDFKTSIKKLFTYNKTYFTLMIIGWISAMASTILALVGPDKLKVITDAITSGLRTGIDLDKIDKIGFLLVLLFSLSFLFNFIEGLIMANVTNRFSKEMRKEIAKKINKLPLSYFDKTTVGDTLSRVTNDIDTIGHTMNQSFSTSFSAL